MTARRYGAMDERAAAGSATALLHHWMGRDHPLGKMMLWPNIAKARLELVS